MMGVFGKKESRKKTGEDSIIFSLDDLVNMIGWDLGDSRVQAIIQRHRLAEMLANNAYSLESS